MVRNGRQFLLSTKDMGVFWDIPAVWDAVELGMITACTPTLPIPVRPQHCPHCQDSMSLSPYQSPPCPSSILHRFPSPPEPFYLSFGIPVPLAQIWLNCTLCFFASKEHNPFHTHSPMTHISWVDSKLLSDTCSFQTIIFFSYLTVLFSKKLVFRTLTRYISPA